MPIPRSRTVHTASAPSRSTAKLTVAPGSEYFTALLRRLVKMCPSNFSSAFDFGGIQAAQDQDLLHHLGHSTRVPGDGLKVFRPFVRLHFLEEITKQFRRRLDDSQRRAEFVRDHGNEIALELA